MGKEVNVIGGGICGLAVAYALVRRGVAVTLLEQSNQLGGLATYFRSVDWYIDKFYHCIMPTDSHLLDLIKELGLSDNLYWKPTRMGFIYDKRRYPFNTALDLLRFSPLTFSQRLRLGIASLLLRRLGRGLDLDKVRTDTWLCKLFGEEIWHRFWEPLFRMKFGSQAGNLPALYIWQRLGRENNVSTRGYLSCGLKGFIEGLESAIKDYGGIIYTNAPVKAIRQAQSRMEVSLASSEVLNSDWVISTVPLPFIRKLLQGSPLENQLASPSLPYQGVISTLCLLSKPLEGYYWSPVVKSNTSFDGVIEMSALVDKFQYGGRNLTYLMKYCNGNSDLFKEPETDIAERWSSELIELYNDLPLRKQDILETRVFKAPFVEPIYPTGYMSVKPSFQVGKAPLIVANTAQIYPNITSMNASVSLANDAAAYFGQQVEKLSQ